MMQVNRRHLAAATSLVSLLTVAVWTGAQTAGAAEQGAASCGANLKDQSKAVGKEPTLDEQRRVFPLVTIHGITGSNADFEDVVDLSYKGYTPSESRKLIENLTGKPGASKVKGFTHVRVYSYEYTKDSLRWVTDPAVGEAFGKVIDCLYEHHGVPVSVLAHSMGGLATRWVANSTDPNGQPRAPKLGKVVTLGTPYTGSAIAAGSGGAIDVAAVLLPPVAALVIYCGWRGTNSGIGNCGPIPVLQSGTSEAGRALRQGSDELSRLSRWPSEVDVTAFAGSMVLSAKLFNASVGSVEIGDGVVGVDSASADADTTPVYECRYEKSLTPAWDALKELLKIRKPEERWAELGNLLLSQPCYHGNLMRNWDMLPEVLGAFADWFAAAGSVGGFDVRSATVPSLCGHSAGQLVDGKLPEDLLVSSDDYTSPGYVSLNTALGSVSTDVDLDGAAETVAVVLCSAPFVGVPPQPDTFVLVFGADGSVRATLSPGFVDITSLSRDGGEITLGMLMCDPEVGGCRPIGQGLSVLVFRDGAYMLKPLDDGRQELMEGDVGEGVRELQQALVDRGYDIEVDGQFGPGTAAAVEAFQKSALLEVSGTTPVATLGALGLGGGLVADFSSIEGWSDALIRYLTYGEQGRLPSAAVKGLSGFVYETSDAVPFSRLAVEPRSDGRTLLALVGQDSRGYGPALILDVCITSAPALDWCGFWSAAND